MNRSGTDSAARPVTTRALRTTSVLGVLALAASCNTGGPADPGRMRDPGARPTQHATDPEHPLTTETLATYIGEYNAQTGEITFTPVQVGPDGRVSQPLVLSTLPSMSSGSTGTTTPTANTVLLHQTAARQVDGACNTLASTGGDSIPGGFAGVCVTIQAISGYSAQEVIRTYVEFSSLTNNITTGAGAGTINTFVNAPPDSDFGTTNTNGGLFSYGRLAPAGTLNSSGAQIDRSTRNWYFQAPSGGMGTGMSFRFVASVKGELVNPISHPAPTVGATECGPLTSSRPAVSSDGRYVVYSTNTIGCRTGGASQVYRFDTQTGTNVLVSHSSAGATTGGNGANDLPSVSADGRYVAWRSTGTNIVPAGVACASGGDAFHYVDTNTVADIYVRDLSTDAIYIASADDSTCATPPGAPNPQTSRPSMSPDGSFVVFDTVAAIDINGFDTNTVADVYRRDIFNAVTDLVSPDTGSRTAAAINGAVANNGLLITFESTDTSFVAGDTANKDVFLQDMSAGSTSVMSWTSGGSPANGSAQNGAISADGHVVAFDSTSSNILGSSTAGRTHVYVRNADGTGLQRADFGVTSGGTIVEASDLANLPVLSNSGRFVVFTSQASNMDPLKTTSNLDAFMFDVRATDPRRVRPYVLSASVTNRVSSAGVASVGAAVESANGNYAVFISSDGSLVTPAAAAGPRIFVAPMR